MTPGYGKTWWAKGSSFFLQYIILDLYSPLYIVFLSDSQAIHVLELVRQELSYSQTSSLGQTRSASIPDMPAIQSFLSDQLNKLNISSPHRPIPQPSKSSKRYYLSHPPSILSPTNALSPIPYPSSPRQLPSTSLLFSLEHPDPSTSPSISFFLSAIPDPIGFLYHSSILIRLHFTAEEVESGESGWRHQLMELELKDGPGLAETSGGKITVSLKWIGDIMREVERGQRDMPAAVKEFKGVCKSAAPLLALIPYSEPLVQSL